MTLRAWFVRNFTCPDCSSWNISMVGNVCFEQDCPSHNRPPRTLPVIKKEDGRTRLPNRRPAIRDRLKYCDSRGDEHIADVSFGFDSEGVIREVFCQAKKEGSDMQGLVHDACIAVSRCLQRGDRIADLARSFGELREEGQEIGRPASVIGALARLGAAVEANVAEGRA